MSATLIRHLSQLVTPRGTSLRKGKAMSELLELEDAAVYMEEGTIRLVGTTAQVEAALPPLTDCQVVEGRGMCALPGFVDSHTHFLFGGHRPEEFAARLGGAEYLDLLRMGGGIQATVSATRAAGGRALARSGKERLDAMLAQGVTTVEGKSGYGLDLDTELLQLRVMRELDRSQAVEIVSTYLGAHAVPTEFAGRGDDYIDFMLQTVLPQIRAEHLARFCDVFCEADVFSVAQARRLLAGARDMGFGLKLHADEIVSLGGAGLGAELGAVSADHLLAISDQDAAALAQSATAATLLPCTAFCLGKPYAPARELIDRGCGVALATDYNPGSCFCDNIALLFSLAAIQMKMTLPEALTALTLNGAAAVGRADKIGSIEPGKQADLVLLHWPSYLYLVYHTAMNGVGAVYKKGALVCSGGTVR